MVDPLSVGVGAAAGKALDSAAAETGGLLRRVFGPAADEAGEALRRKAAVRFGNVERIAAAAERRVTHNGRTGSVPPRVAHKLLEDGSYCDDELMAEYLGGVLASGLTPSGRDDRAISWSNLITSMSAVQVHAHYLMYTEWAALLADNADIDFDNDQWPAGLDLVIDQVEFGQRLQEIVPDASADELVDHVMTGLLRFELLNSFNSTWGSRDQLLFSLTTSVPYPELVKGVISNAGVELWGWGHGLSHIDISTWGADVHRLGLVDNPIIPRLKNAVFPGLDTVPRRTPPTD